MNRDEVEQAVERFIEDNNRNYVKSNEIAEYTDLTTKEVASWLRKIDGIEPWRDTSGIMTWDLSSFDF